MITNDAVRDVGARARVWGARACVWLGVLSALCGQALAGSPADRPEAEPCGAEDGGEVPLLSAAPTAPMLTSREQRQERRRWRQTLRDQPLWTVARARYGRGEAPQIISRLDHDPTQATRVRQELVGGASYTSTWMLGAFAMWSRLELPAMSANDVAGLVSDVQSALAPGEQQWQSRPISDGSRSYQTSDLSAAFRLHVTPAGVVIDTHDAVVRDDVMWMVVSGLFESAGAWSVTERVEDRVALPGLSVGMPQQVEQSFSEGIHYRRDARSSLITMTNAQEEHVSAIIAALMSAQAPRHDWESHPWLPGDRTFYSTVQGVDAFGGIKDTDRHRLPFWVYQRGNDVEIWLTHAAFAQEPLWWSTVEHVAPTARPTTEDNGWLGDVTDDHRVSWSGSGGRSCQVFSHGFVFCHEVDQMSPLAMLMQNIAFPAGHDDISRAVLSGLAETTDDGAAWRSTELTRELLRACQVSVQSTGIDVYCSSGIETGLSGEPF